MVDLVVVSFFGWLLLTTSVSAEECDIKYQMGEVGWQKAFKQLNTCKAGDVVITGVSTYCSSIIGKVCDLGKFVDKATQFMGSQYFKLTCVHNGKNVKMF